MRLMKVRHAYLLHGSQFLALKIADGVNLDVDVQKSVAEFKVCL